MADLLALLNDPGPRAVAGLIAAGTVSMAAFRTRSLSASGAIVSTAVGGAIVAGIGWWGGVALILYFVSSSALSHLSQRRRAHADQQRGEQRDAVQVAANGGIAALLALACLALSQNTVVAVGVFAAIAAAAADTWATEVGRLSNSAPRLITTGQRVTGGTSGGVSVMGTGAALAGSLLIGLFSMLDSLARSGDTAGVLQAFLIVTVAGFAGAMVDSLLGATVQQQRWCATCHAVTERSVHGCGTVTTHASGVAWMDNDVVNALAIAAAASFAMVSFTFAR